MGLYILDVRLLIKVFFVHYIIRYKYWVEQLQLFKKQGKSGLSPTSKSTLDSIESSPDLGQKVIIFTERSLSSDRFVFLENAWKNGLISELEY